ncbi:MAG: DUF4364 family protein [Roseburia sp.]|nr:DUF4364 family protein [Roseburia sp.]
MSQELFTLYKLIILYMLDKVKFKMTYSQLSRFILEREYTNFITLQQLLSELQDTELIEMDDSHTNRTYLTITAEGRRTLSYFRGRIGKAIIADIDSYLAENHLELKSEAALTADYHRTADGEYAAILSVREQDKVLASVTLSVPTERLAEKVCENWYRKNQQIYKYLVGELF